MQKEAIQHSPTIIHKRQQRSNSQPILLKPKVASLQFPTYLGRVKLNKELMNYEKPKDIQKQQQQLKQKPEQIFTPPKKIVDENQRQKIRQKIVTGNEKVISFIEQFQQQIPNNVMKVEFSSPQGNKWDIFNQNKKMQKNKYFTEKKEEPNKNKNEKTKIITKIKQNLEFEDKKVFSNNFLKSKPQEKKKRSNTFNILYNKINTNANNNTLSTGKNQNSAQRFQKFSIPQELNFREDFFMYQKMQVKQSERNSNKAKYIQHRDFEYPKFKKHDQLKQQYEKKIYSSQRKYTDYDDFYKRAYSTIYSAPGMQISQINQSVKPKTQQQRMRSTINNKDLQVKQIHQEQQQLQEQYSMNNQNSHEDGNNLQVQNDVTPRERTLSVNRKYKIQQFQQKRSQSVNNLKRKIDIQGGGVIQGKKYSMNTNNSTKSIEKKPEKQVIDLKSLNKNNNYKDNNLDLVQMYQTSILNNQSLKISNNSNNNKKIQKKGINHISMQGWSTFEDKYEQDQQFEEIIFQ